MMSKLGGVFFCFLALAAPAALRGREADPLEALAAGEAASQIPFGARGGRSPAPAVAVRVAGRGRAAVTGDRRFRLDGLPLGLPQRVELLGAGEAAPQLLDEGGPVAAGAQSPPSGPGERSVRFDFAAGRPSSPRLRGLRVEIGGGRGFLASSTGDGAPVALSAEAGDGARLAISASDPRVALESLDSRVAAFVPGADPAFLRAGGLGCAWVRLAGEGETAIGSFSVDTRIDRDGDGLPDAWERAHGLDAGSPGDRDGDRDGDGLTNIEEFRLGTRPDALDSDGDGLADGVEVATRGTDPTRRDTDGDGADDAVETSSGLDPLNPNSRPGAAFTPVFRSAQSFLFDIVDAAASRDFRFFVLDANGRFFSYELIPSSLFTSFLDSLTIAGTLRAVAVDGDRAFVAAGSAGVHVLSIADPADTVLLQTIGGLGVVAGIQALDGMVYLGTDTGLRLLEPAPGGGYRAAGGFAAEAVTRLAVHGRFAYLGLPVSNRLAIVDVSAPASPRLAGFLTMPAGSPRFAQIAASGDAVYVAHGSSGVVAVSVRDPASPRIIDSTAARFPGSVMDAVAVNGNLMAAHSRADALRDRALLFRLREDGTFEDAGTAPLNVTASVALTLRQNFLMNLAGAPDKLVRFSQVLPQGDAGGSAPSGELVVRGGRAAVRPNEDLVIDARAADDVAIESVDFFLSEALLFRDSVPPFRLVHRVPAGAPPGPLLIRAFGRDLRGNSGPVGALVLEVESDLDGDGVLDGDDADLDGDGIPDFEERVAGADGHVTDPERADTDGDGIPDGEESIAGADGFITHPGAADTDGDGLLDAEEIVRIRSDPGLADSDGDGILDGFEDADDDLLDNLGEILAGTNPAAADSDGDGLLDGVEVALGFDPLRGDSDGDGVPDGAEDADGDGLSVIRELELGSDPGRIDSDGDGVDDGTEAAIGTSVVEVTDFSRLDVVVRDRTAIFSGSVAFRSLSLVRAVLTVPRPGAADEVAPLAVEVENTFAIDAASRIDVRAHGYPGGGAGGSAEARGTGPLGPAGEAGAGGSHGGLGGSPAADEEAAPGEPYGSIFLPAFAGSGGGSRLDGPPSQARGGAGGGAIHVRARTLSLDGVFDAGGEGAGDAQYGGGAGGAGGACLIEAVTLRGAGRILANGGAVAAPAQSAALPGTGGGGRVAIHVEALEAWSMARVEARGGGVIGGAGGAFAFGGAGTIFVKVGASDSGSLIIDNGGLRQETPRTPLPSVGRGVVAALTDTTLRRQGGEFPPDVVGLRIDPDAQDSQETSFRILAVEGDTVTTEPGLVAASRAGAPFQGVLRLAGLAVRNGAEASSDDAIEVLGAGNAGGGLEQTFVNSVLEAAALRFGVVETLRVQSARLSLGALRGPAGSFDALTLSASELELAGLLDASSISCDASRLVLAGPLRAGALELRGSTLTAPPSTERSTFPLDLAVDGLVSIDATSRIDLVGRGYVGGRRDGNTLALGQTVLHATPAAGGRSGGSHGGIGGFQGTGAGLGIQVPPAFDTYHAPRFPGGGGSAKLDDAADQGHNGGGLLKLAAGTLQLDGRIDAGGEGVDNVLDGVLRLGGGGAGGGIDLAVGTLRGAGEILARGGSASSSSGAGAGGGGRIALRYQSIEGFDLARIRAPGGALVPAPATAKPSSTGGAGTVLLRSAAQSYGDLIVDNAGQSQSLPRTVFRALGSGNAGFLAAHTLTAGKQLPATDVGLTDQWVTLAGNTTRAFRITANTTGIISTSPADGSMLEVGANGSPYQGAFVFDNLTVRGAGILDSSGNLIIIATGAAVVTDGVLIAPPVVEW